MDEEEFTKDYEHGRKLKLDEAIALVLDWQQFIRRNYLLLSIHRDLIKNQINCCFEKRFVLKTLHAKIYNNCVASILI